MDKKPVLAMDNGSSVIFIEIDHKYGGVRIIEKKHSDIVIMEEYSKMPTALMRALAKTMAPIDIVPAYAKPERPKLPKPPRYLDRKK